MIGSSRIGLRAISPGGEGSLAGTNGSPFPQVRRGPYSIRRSTARWRAADRDVTPSFW
jgi:hypothetical protein